MLKDAFYPLAGSGSTYLGMIIGIIDVHSLYNAFIIGMVGALGGLFVRFLINLIKDICKWKIKH